MWAAKMLRILSLFRKKRLRHPPEEILHVGPIDAKFNRPYRAQSRSTPGQTYQVNVAQLTCTCPDFQKRRSKYPTGDVRRVCKHIYDKLYQTKVERSFDPVLKLVIRYGRRERHFIRIHSSDGDIVFGYCPERPWVRVLAVIADGPFLASFNLEESRWAIDDHQGDGARARHERYILSELKQRFSWGR